VRDEEDRGEKKMNLQHSVCWFYALLGKDDEEKEKKKKRRWVMHDLLGKEKEK